MPACHTTPTGPRHPDSPVPVRPRLRPLASILLSTTALLLTLTHLSTQAATPPAPELGIDQSAGTVRLTLQGEDGREYSVEAVESMLNAGHVWKPVATVAPAPGRPAVLLDPTCSTKPQNFYRLRLLQGAIPVEVPNFRLLDLAGEAHELFYQSDARAVVLIPAGPDLSIFADPQTDAGLAAHLRSLATTLAPRNVRIWILADATPADRERLRSQADALGLTGSVTILEDEGGTVTRTLGTESLPEAVAVTPGSWSILYRGRIRDTVATASGSRLEHPLLADALQQHLDGSRVLVRRTATEGRPLPTRDLAGRTYSRDIAPLLQKACVKCHSPGNIAPWAMTNHAIVGDYAPLMKDEILARRMPPWHADRQPQAYSNDDMLSPDELAQLVHWIDQGAPRGDGPDPLADAVPPAPPQWPLGTPDRIVTLQKQSIPASGTIDYRYLVMPNPFTTDVWLRAAAVRPGTPSVVHHVIVFTASTFADILQVQGGLGGYFAAYVPGMDQGTFPEGTGKLLKKGAFLVFQVHYTASGKAEADQTQLGLYVSPSKPAAELRTAAAYDTLFSIPAGAANHPATAEFTLPFDAVVHEMSPHMHYRGRWFRFEAVYPDNHRETLLNVPFYRFDWQTLYRLKQPKRLPSGTRIVLHGGWDNSTRNPYNPDPGANVRFGEQSWEEMFIGYFNFSPANP